MLLTKHKDIFHIYGKLLEVQSRSVSEAHRALPFRKAITSITVKWLRESSLKIRTHCSYVTNLVIIM